MEAGICLRGDRRARAVSRQSIRYGHRTDQKCGSAGAGQTVRGWCRQKLLEGRAVQGASPSHQNCWPGSDVEAIGLRMSARAVTSLWVGGMRMKASAARRMARHRSCAPRQGDCWSLWLAPSSPNSFPWYSASTIPRETSSSAPPGGRAQVEALWGMCENNPSGNPVGSKRVIAEPSASSAGGCPALA
jgi:hypothetical protein